MFWMMKNFARCLPATIIRQFFAGETTAPGDCRQTSEADSANGLKRGSTAGIQND
jgi:hypothetical protein